ncbi:hypothetical protein BJX70DRAFT_391334 [Aspergillus crustosus]
MQHQQHHAHASNGATKKHRKMNSFAKLSTKTNNKNIASSCGNKNIEQIGSQNPGHDQQKPKQRQHRRPIVPFSRRDRILLVGEGDFSFAHSLATHHRCRNIIATCYDSKETLHKKYPKAEKNIVDILLESKSKSKARINPKTDEKPTPVKVLFSVDAKRLGSPSGGGKDVRIGFPRKVRETPAWKKDENKKIGDNTDKGGPWDVICFNFPHVGGISTDVNRQVRANQELLVSFFKACVPLLAGRPERVDEDDDEEDDEDDWGSDTGVENASDDDVSAHASQPDNDYEGDIVRAKGERRAEPGQILVTLFEGEPYTLWNIRDLARHAGLRVVTSFRFPWPCYRGYSHARTLGEIQGKDGVRGGWRGEDRQARMYVFELKMREPGSGITAKRKKTLVETDDPGSD